MVLSSGFNKLIILSIVLLLSTAGCSSGKQEPSYKVEEVNTSQVKAYNDFALHVADKLLKQSGGENLFISPLSIAFALSLVVNGAEGETRAELQRTLGVDDLSMESFNKGNQVLTDLLEHGDSEVDLTIANGLWARKETPLLEDYIDVMKKSYGVKTKTLDFESSGAAKTINRWVKKSTNGRIEEIVEPAQLKANVMILANAIYFNGKWTKPFEASDTREAPFYLTDGSEEKVQMMVLRDTLPYKETGDFKAVRLPYGSGNWDMVIVLPHENLPLSEAAPRLLANAKEWRVDFKKGKAVIKLPRFTMKYEQSLTDTLRKLGVIDAFDPAKANFSAMTGRREGVYITDVLHQSYLEVNEQGTEAAAVTSVDMAGSAPPVDEPFNIELNRPFFFAIEDHSTGAIVFMGTMFNPL